MRISTSTASCSSVWFITRWIFWSSSWGTTLRHLNWCIVRGIACMGRVTMGGLTCWGFSSIRTSILKKASAASEKSSWPLKKGRNWSTSSLESASTPHCIWRLRKTIPKSSTISWSREQKSISTIAEAGTLSRWQETSKFKRSKSRSASWLTPGIQCANLKRNSLRSQKSMYRPISTV